MHEKLDAILGLFGWAFGHPPPTEEPAAKHQRTVSSLNPDADVFQPVSWPDPGVWEPLPAAAVCIQRYIRAYQARWFVFPSAEQQAAAVTIQRHVRGHRARTLLKSYSEPEWEDEDPDPEEQAFRQQLWDEKGLLVWMEVTLRMVNLDPKATAADKFTILKNRWVDARDHIPPEKKERMKKMLEDSFGQPLP